MKKVPSLLKIKEGVTKEIKKRDPKAKPKLTKVGLIDLMPQKDARRIRQDSEGIFEKYGASKFYNRLVKRMAIDWFKKQREGN